MVWKKTIPVNMVLPIVKFQFHVMVSAITAEVYCVGIIHNVKSISRAIIDPAYVLLKLLGPKVSVSNFKNGHN